MMLAEFGTGQVLWSIFWFYLFVMWIWLVISVIGDIFGSRDLSGGAKAIWALAIVVIPYVGVLIYLVARGDHMAERSLQAAADRDQAARSYIQETAGTTSVADELSKLANLRASGTIDEAEYAAAKANLLG